PVQACSCCCNHNKDQQFFENRYLRIKPELKHNDERIEEIIGTLAYFEYKKARPLPRSIKLVLTVFLWTPVIDFLLVGIPHHPQANQDHWQAQELSFAHPANEQLAIVWLTEEFNHKTCQAITDQEQRRNCHTWTRLGAEPPQYNKQDQ